MTTARSFTLRITGDLSTTAGEPAGYLGLDLLEATGFLRWNFLADQQPQAGDPTYQERLYAMEITPEHIAGANALMLCRPYVRPSAFARGANDLVAIARAGIGYDKIDLVACTANDVVVFNTPHGMTHSTASAAMFFILALSKRFPLQQRIVREHRWDLQKDAVGDDLAGLTLGLIGLGKSALELVRLIAPFGMKVIAYSPHADPAQAKAANVELVASLDELMRRSDYVSLHGRLDAKTRGMLGERELGLMKPTAYLVNVARGEIVDEHALIRALRAKGIAGAGLDVYEVEPLPPDSPLLGLDNVLLTPHWMCSTRQAGRASAVDMANDILRVMHGELPDHILNPAVVDRPGFRQKLSRFKR